MTQPTRTLRRTIQHRDDTRHLGPLEDLVVEVEHDAKHSVEITVLANGTIKPTSVKVYALTETEAGDRALAEVVRLQAKIDALAAERTTQQLQDSVKGIAAAGIATVGTASPMVRLPKD